MSRHTPLLRAVAALFALAAGSGAAALFLQYSSAIGLTGWAFVSAGLLFVSTTWLAWGAALGVIGLWPMRAPLDDDEAPVVGRTVVLLPVCHEDAAVTFARIAAMQRSLSGLPARVDFAILSDSRDPHRVVEEEHWFARLKDELKGSGSEVFYRRRTNNVGRKAGNLGEFFRRSGGAWDYAMILDADSLMEGRTILRMIRRMEADPSLGLLQSLPVVVRAKSIFGRAMQFSASFHSPVFTRGLARLAGKAGPFWGHNALVRTRAFAECCGLPVLSGEPPFGGHILSHDFVEAALLARGGWTVRVDPDLVGSYEEAPETLIEHAKRDRRWCQGNLQHSRLVGAPRLRFWSRAAFLQGIFAYVAPLFWAGFLIAAALDRATLPPLDYFPDPHQFFPVFPTDETAKAIGLMIGIVGLLIMPKLLVVAEAALTGRARGFGGALSALASTLAELVLTSLLAPVLMCYQTRSVLQVLAGADSGWPSNIRDAGRLTLAEAWSASRFMPVLGVAGMIAAHYTVPGLMLWLLPVFLPMILAPVLIAWTSRSLEGSALFRTPSETDVPPILSLHDAVLARWQPASAADTPEAVPAAVRQGALADA